MNAVTVTIAHEFPNCKNELNDKLESEIESAPRNLGE